jgi:hypothetical protein
MLTTLIKTTLTCCVLLAIIGCKGRGSNWRLHEQKQITQMPMSNEASPDWVKGIVPQSESRIFFVGRSRTPDTPKNLDGYYNIRKNGKSLNENAHLYNHPPKEAAVLEYDRFYRDPSQRTGFTVMDERDAVQSAREDILDQMQQRLAPRNMSENLSPLAREMNINLESMMPSLAAYLSEEEVYFEKWHVHEGSDSNGRPMAEGRDEWQSYKCWMLCSIPAEEFYSIAELFRERNNDFYERALDRQEKQREWNREDEIATLKHTMEINKDRETIPGRRFTLED